MHYVPDSARDFLPDGAAQRTGSGLPGGRLSATSFHYQSAPVYFLTLIVVGAPARRGFGDRPVCRPRVVSLPSAVRISARPLGGRPRRRADPLSDSRGIVRGSGWRRSRTDDRHLGGHHPRRTDDGRSRRLHCPVRRERRGLHTRSSPVGDSSGLRSLPRRWRMSSAASARSTCPSRTFASAKP